MSWSQFVSLISEDNRNVYMHFVSCGDVTAVDDLCSFVVGLVNKAVEQSGAVNGLHSCLCGDRIPLDEYRCSNCREWETARH